MGAVSESWTSSTAPAPVPTSLKTPSPGISLLFTDVAGTKAAVGAAGKLASGLELPMRLHVARVVPFHLPLESPAIPIGCVERDVARTLSALSWEIGIRIILCRDRNEAFSSSLGRGSRVIAGVKDSGASGDTADCCGSCGRKDFPSLSSAKGESIGTV